MPDQPTIEPDDPGTTIRHFIYGLIPGLIAGLTVLINALTRFVPPQHTNVLTFSALFGAMASMTIWIYYTVKRVSDKFKLLHDTALAEIRALRDTCELQCRSIQSLHKKLDRLLGELSVINAELSKSKQEITHLRTLVINGAVPEDTQRHGPRPLR